MDNLDKEQNMQLPPKFSYRHEGTENLQSPWKNMPKTSNLVAGPSRRELGHPSVPTLRHQADGCLTRSINSRSIGQRPLSTGGKQRERRSDAEDPGELHRVGWDI